MIRRLLSRPSRPISVISMALLILGLASCGAGFAITLIGSSLPTDIELPLGALSGLAVDDDGRIYCAVQFYGRLQQYDSEGRFLEGVHIPAAAGAFKVKWNDQNQRVVVATVRNRMAYEFNSELDLVVSGRNPELFFEMNKYDATSVTRNDATYTLSDFLLLNPHIIKTDAYGSDRTIVRSPFHLWVVMGPAPAFFYIVVGVALRFIAAIP